VHPGLHWQRGPGAGWPPGRTGSRRPEGPGTGTGCCSVLQRTSAQNSFALQNCIFLSLFLLFSLDDYRGEIGKMCEWYHRTLAGGTLALNALLMLM
jgi:hypothetical protein